mgnify:CR=1 FL=1
MPTLPFRLLVLCSVLVLWAPVLVGQEVRLGAEEIFQRAAQEADRQPVELRHVGRELRRAPNAECPELQAGWALELFAEGMGNGGADMSECLAEVQQCPTVYTRLHWYIGFLLYRQGEFAEALVQMDLALSDDLVQLEALNARGGLHALLGDYEAAAADFTELLELGDDATPISAFVNLSGIHLVMENWDEAIRWTNKGLEQVQKTREEMASSSAEFAQLAEVEHALLSNQLAAATQKGDEAIAHSTWDKMDLVDLEQANASNLKSILEFALTDDRFQIYEFLKEEGRRRWAELPENQWKELGVSNLLLNPQWDHYFVADSAPISPADSLLRRWHVVRAMYFLSGGAAWQESGNDSWFEVRKVGWGFLVAAISLLLFTGRWWWRQRRVHLELKRPRHTFEDFIAGFTALGHGMNFEVLLEELNGFLERRRSSIHWSELNAGETEVLLAIMAGKGSKDIAQMTNRSPASVYNMRSNIRRKLNIPDGVELETWCAEMNGVG